MSQELKELKTKLKGTKKDKVVEYLFDKMETIKELKEKINELDGRLGEKLLEERNDVTVELENISPSKFPTRTVKGFLTMRVNVMDNGSFWVKYLYGTGAYQHRDNTIYMSGDLKRMVDSKANMVGHAELDKK